MRQVICCIFFSIYTMGSPDVPDVCTGMCTYGCVIQYGSLFCCSNIRDIRVALWALPIEKRYFLLSLSSLSLGSIQCHNVLCPRTKEEVYASDYLVHPDYPISVWCQDPPICVNFCSNDIWMRAECHHFPCWNY